MAADGPGWTIFVKEKIAMTAFQILGSENLTRCLVAAMRGLYGMLRTAVHIQDPMISVRVLCLSHNN